MWINVTIRRSTVDYMYYMEHFIKKLWLIKYVRFLSLEYKRVSHLSAIVDLQEPAPLRATTQVNSSQGLARSNGGFD